MQNIHSTELEGYGYTLDDSNSCWIPIVYFVYFLYASCVVIFIDLSKRERRETTKKNNHKHCVFIPSVCMWLN